MNVLFALTVDTKAIIENSIVNTYKDKFEEEITFKQAFYKEDIVSLLESDKFDVLFLNTRIEKEPMSLEMIDALTDKYHDLQIILLIEENDIDFYTQGLYSMACYNGIYRSDFTLDLSAELIKNPRTKKDAKSYYGIDDSSSVQEIQNNSIDEIEDSELEIVLKNFNTATSETISELFDIAVKTYKKSQLVYLISLLNDNTIELLKDNGCNIEPYQRVLNKEVKQIDKKIKKQKKKPEIIYKEKEVEKIVEVEKVVEKKVFVDREVYTTPTDYKKVIAVVSTARNVGASTIVENMSDKFVKANKAVAVIDLSDNKDLFERNIFNSDLDYSNNSLFDLCNNNEDKPYVLKNNVKLYSSAPNHIGDIKRENLLAAISKVKNTNEVVILDVNIEDLSNIAPILDKTFLIITQELTNTKYFTDRIRDDERELLESLKPNFIINKYLSTKLSTKDIVECYLCKIGDYFNCNNNIEIIRNKEEIFTIPFSQEIVLSNYNQELNKYEEVEESIYAICNKAYPINQVKQDKNKSLWKKIFKK